MTRQKDIPDNVVKGLVVRLAPSGAHVYYLRCRINGQQSRIKIAAVTVLTLEEARRRAQDMLGAIARGDDPRKPKAVQGLTLGGWLREHYEPWVTANRKAGAAMVADIKRAFPALLKKRMDRLTRWDIDKWRSERLKVRKPATVNRPVAYLRAAMNKAVEWQHLAVNPLARYKLTREDASRVRYLDADELRRLMEALDKREARIREERAAANAWRRDRGYPLMQDLSTTAHADHLKPMVLVSLNTGVRRGELFSLEWRDISFEQRTLTVRAESAKSGRARHIPLNAVAYAALAGWREQTTGEGLVFTSPKTGGRFDNANKAWGAVLEEAGIVAFTWHDMRHHFASMLAMRGATLTVIRDLLGHADFETTLRYAHLSPQVRADAVALLDAPDNIIPLARDETGG